jgi:hypothetical protein
MNVVNGYEYYPTPAESLYYKFTKTCNLSVNAPWENEPQSNLVVDKSTPITGAWKFAYREVGVIPPSAWNYIYHVTLVDNRDGWTELANVEGGATASYEPQTDPTKPESVLIIAIVGVCLYLLFRKDER